MFMTFLQDSQERSNNIYFIGIQIMETNFINQTDDIFLKIELLN